MSPIQRQAIIWTNADLIHCIDAALGGDELMPLGNKPLPEPMLTQIYIIVWHH